MKTETATLARAAAIVFALLPFQAFGQTSGDMIGSWKYLCTNGACQAYIALREGNRHLVTLSIQKDKASNALSIAARSPLGTILPPGVRIYTSEETFFPLAFQICLSDGCTAIALIDDAIRTQLQSPSVVQVAYFRQDTVDGETKGFTMDVPIGGIEKVFEVLDTESN